MVIIFQKEYGNTFTLFIIFTVKSLQKEQNSTNLPLHYDPQSVGINLQSPQSDSTPWTWARYLTKKRKMRNGMKSTKEKNKTYVSAFLDVLPDRTTFSLSIPETSNEAGSILISLFRPDLVTNISISKYSASLSQSDEDNRLFKIFIVICQGVMTAIWVLPDLWYKFVRRPWTRVSVTKFLYFNSKAWKGLPNKLPMVNWITKLDLFVQYFVHSIFSPFGF